MVTCGNTATGGHLVVGVGKADQGAQDLKLVERAAGVAARGEGELVEGEASTWSKSSVYLLGLGADGYSHGSGGRCHHLKRGTGQDPRGGSKHGGRRTR